mmetsp:Transcript_2794/g.7813  ORF Transcript_2794/g.7813 Transcript_2794/m.7813 type:complete len:200 (-) Transcript_2794:681-1280(-)
MHVCMRTDPLRYRVAALVHAMPCHAMPHKHRATTANALKNVLLAPAHRRDHPVRSTPVYIRAWRLPQDDDDVDLAADLTDFADADPVEDMRVRRGARMAQTKPRSLRRSMRLAVSVDLCPMACRRYCLRCPFTQIPSCGLGACWVGTLVCPVSLRNATRSLYRSSQASSCVSHTKPRCCSLSLRSSVSVECLPSRPFLY